jgi:hypothetical protein
LHRRGGDDHDLTQNVDQDSHIDELAGPELQLLVRESGLEFDGPGGLIDLVVHHLHFAVVDRVALRPQRVNRQHALGEPPGKFRHVLLRQVEKHRDRLDLRDDDDAGGVRGVHDIALVHHSDAGASGERRDDIGVGEDGPCIVDRTLIEIDLRFELGDERPLGIELLLVDGVG